MGIQDDFLEQLQEDLLNINKQEEDINKEYEVLQDKEDELYREKLELNNKLNELREKDFEAGFLQWQEQLDESDKNPRPYEYKLTQEETLKLQYLEHLHANEHQGAIGGGTTLNFTQTSIGVVISATINGKEYRLTDFSDF